MPREKPTTESDRLAVAMTRMGVANYVELTAALTELEQQPLVGNSQAQHDVGEERDQ